MADKNELQISPKDIFLIAVPGVIAMGLFLYSFFNYFGEPFFDDLILFSFLIGVTPFAAGKYVEFSHMRKMESEFPSFLADVSSGVDSGMSIPQAIYVTKDREYGLLNEQIEIIEANKAGGDIREILQAASRNARELKNIERETDTMIKPYILICYITYFVFLVVILILYKTFIQPMSGGAGAGFIEAGLSTEGFTTLFFRMLMLQGLFIGLAAGKMAEKRIIAGLKHAIILIVSGYIMFNAVTEWGLI
ncbi:MAG: type II secretion system F family protein [Theionarchaea archaeon]|nr:type II secretion system F family protein [Theionarchaea archaeon]